MPPKKGVTVKKVVKVKKAASAAAAGGEESGSSAVPQEQPGAAAAADAPQNSGAASSATEAVAEAAPEVVVPDVIAEDGASGRDPPPSESEHSGSTTSAAPQEEPPAASVGAGPQTAAVAAHGSACEAQDTAAAEEVPGGSANAGVHAVDHPVEAAQPGATAPVDQPGAAEEAVQAAAVAGGDAPSGSGEVLTRGAQEQGSGERASEAAEEEAVPSAASSSPPAPASGAESLSAELRELRLLVEALAKERAGDGAHVSGGGAVGDGAPPAPVHVTPTPMIADGGQGMATGDGTHAALQASQPGVEATTHVTAPPVLDEATGVAVVASSAAVVDALVASLESARSDAVRERLRADAAAEDCSRLAAELRGVRAAQQQGDDGTAAATLGEASDVLQATLGALATERARLADAMSALASQSAQLEAAQLQMGQLRADVSAAQTEAASASAIARQEVAAELQAARQVAAQAQGALEALRHELAQERAQSAAAVAQLQPAHGDMLHAAKQAADASAAAASEQRAALAEARALLAAAKAEAAAAAASAASLKEAQQAQQHQVDVHIASDGAAAAHERSLREAEAAAASAERDTLQAALQAAETALAQERERYAEAMRALHSAGNASAADMARAQAALTESHGHVATLQKELRIERKRVAELLRKLRSMETEHYEQAPPRAAVQQPVSAATPPAPAGGNVKARTATEVPVVPAQSQSGLESAQTLGERALEHALAQERLIQQQQVQRREPNGSAGGPTSRANAVLAVASASPATDVAAPDTTERRHDAVGEEFPMNGSTLNALDDVPLGSISALRSALGRGSATDFVNACALAESRASLGASERAAMCREGAATVLVDALSSFRSELAAQLAALDCMRVLATLSVGRDNCATLVAAGAVEACVASMLRHPESAELQECCARTLLRLVLEPGAIGRVVAAGGVSALVEAMNGHTGSARVQEHCCWMVRNLGVDPINQGIIAHAGGIAACVTACRQHAGSAPVLKAACQALWSLAVDPVNQGAIGRAGGIEVICDALRSGVPNARLHESAAGALWNTCCNADNALRAAAAGGVEALAAGMRQHPGEAGVQWRGCGACAVMAATGRPEILRRQREAGVPALARAALARFPAHDALQAEAKSALERSSRVVLAGLDDE